MSKYAVRINAVRGDVYLKHIMRRQQYDAKIEKVVCWTPCPLEGHLYNTIDKARHERGYYGLTTVADIVEVTGTVINMVPDDPPAPVGWRAAVKRWWK